jgi:hypothetical protein
MLWYKFDTSGALLLDFGKDAMSEVSMQSPASKVFLNILVVPEDGVLLLADLDRAAAKLYPAVSTAILTQITLFSNPPVVSGPGHQP